MCIKFAVTVTVYTRNAGCSAAATAAAAANQPLPSHTCPFALCRRCRQRMTRVGDLDSELEINAQGLRCRSFNVRCCVFVCVCARESETLWNETMTERSDGRERESRAE